MESRLSSIYGAGGKRSNLSGPKKPVNALRWSEKGRYLASGGLDGVVRLHSEQSPVPAEYRSTTSSSSSSTSSSDSCVIEQVDWRCDGGAENIFASTGSDAKVRVWDARVSPTERRAMVRELNVAAASYSIRWSGCGKYIGSADKGDVLSVFDVRTWSTLLRRPYRGIVNEIAFAPAHNTLLVPYGRGTVDVLAFNEQRKVKQANGNGNGAAASSSSSSSPSSSSPFQLKAGRPLQAHMASCFCIDFDVSGRQFAIGSQDGTATLWDTDSLTCTRHFAHTTKPVRALSFSPDSALLALAPEDNCVNIVLCRTGHALHRIPLSSPAASIAYHPRAHLLAVAPQRIDNFADSCISLYTFS
jgi:THO complex subunit 3